MPVSTTNENNSKINESFKAIIQVATSQYGEMLTLNQWYVTLAIAELAGIAKLISEMHNNTIIFSLFAMSAILLFIMLSLLVYCISDIQHLKREISKKVSMLSQQFLLVDLNKLDTDKLSLLNDLFDELWLVLKTDKEDKYTLSALVMFLAATFTASVGVALIYFSK